MVPVITNQVLYGIELSNLAPAPHDCTWSRLGSMFLLKSLVPGFPQNMSHHFPIIFASPSLPHPRTSPPPPEPWIPKATPDISTR